MVIQVYLRWMETVYITILVTVPQQKWSNGFYKKKVHKNQMNLGIPRKKNNHVVKSRKFMEESRKNPKKTCGVEKPVKNNEKCDAEKLNINNGWYLWNIHNYQTN